MDLILTHPIIWNILFALGISLAVIFAAMAYAEDRLVKSLIFLTISAAGWLLILFILNTPISIKTAYLLLLSQVIGLVGLLLSINAKRQDFGKAAYILCAFSVIGLPPFIGFWPKFLTYINVVKDGFIWLGALLGITTLLILFTLLKGLNKLSTQEKPNTFTYIALGLGVVSLALGFFPKIVFELFNSFIR